MDENYAVEETGWGWKVHKLDPHHGSYSGYYEVRVVGEDVVCSCPRAGQGCKHVVIVSDWADSREGGSEPNE